LSNVAYNRVRESFRESFDRFKKGERVIAFDSGIRRGRPLLSVLILLTVWTTSVRAEVIVPFTPGNLLSPTLKVAVTPEPDGTYRYNYEIENAATSKQKAWFFELELHGDVSDVRSPQGWSFGEDVSGRLCNWACTEVAPLAPGEVDDGDVPPCRYSIAPGSKLSGFSFRSIHPPGDVKYWIQGETPLPVTTDDDEPMAGAGVSFHNDSVSGVINGGGPVSLHTCSGAVDGQACDDGLFCNGADTCLNGRCSQHAGNPCTGQDDGDDDCAEACDEDNNNCFYYNSPGSPCRDDGNLWTEDYCDLGVCVHPAGKAGADSNTRSAKHD